MHFLHYVSVAAVVFTLCTSSGLAEVKRRKFSTSSAYLVVEVLDDDLVHCELSAIGSGPSLDNPLYASPMILKADYAGPTMFSESGNVLETSDLRLEVNTSNLCVKFIDKKLGNAYLTTVCPRDLGQAQKGLNIDPAAIQHVYGLGQQFKMHGAADGDWTSLGIRQGGPLGNAFEGFGGGAVGNVQIPVMYAVGQNVNYALFFDNVYKQSWDFQKFWWEVTSFGDQLRYYILAGPILLDLRKDFMELTGRPPVPPRKAFGLWVSEFGYDNWGQIDQLKSQLRNEKFPLDGFVLDLNWFGGVSLANPSQGRMGRLNWDETNDTNNPYFFPTPKTQIENYAQDHIGLTVIEESYLANNSDTFSAMPTEFSSFARDSNGQCDQSVQTTAVTDVSGFWGKGRMIDWSDANAGKFIHNQRRFPNLVKNGVTAHWTDLGEPENFNGTGCYEGVETMVTGRKNEHSDIHNLYNLLWNKSIWDGYFEKRGAPSALGLIAPRPFIVTRSGAAGTQRFGAAMWSGDIAANLGSLATHANAQMHMSFSGIDFYGADIGGFRREALPYNDKVGSYRHYEGETYTQWFANGCWFDVPVRPHTDNEFIAVSPEYETAPHLVGKKDSNRANLRQRYELIPYYYSLAHRAHLFGEPVCPPLVMYYQNDPQVRRVGHEKLIGRDLLVGVVARYGEYDRDLYLPAGKWVNYHSREWFDSQGQTLHNVPTYRQGLFRLPVFARAGSILPMMHVDEHTKDAFGHRLNGDDANQAVIVQVYADRTPTSFTLYEDDGLRLQYESDARPKYHHRTTEISQQQVDADTVRVRIESAVDVNGIGPFDGAVDSRHNVVRLIVEEMEATSVRLDGMPLVERASEAALQSAVSGWVNAGRNLILAKSPKLGVGAAKEFAFELQPIPPLTSVNFVCDNGFTTPGVSIYVSGDIPELGSFDPSRAIKLDPNIYYDYIVNPPIRNFGPGPSAPLWSGVIAGLPANKRFEWKCIRKREDGTGGVEFEPGPNNVHTTGPLGYSGRALGSF